MSVLEQDSRKKLVLGHESNTLVFLIIINVIAFIFLSFFKITYLVSNSTVEAFNADVLYYCTVPARFDVFLTRPWTLVTYMFANGDEWQMIANMLWLWCFGFILSDLAGHKRLVPLYIYGGLAGAIVFLLSVNLIPFFNENINSYYPLIGSGTSVMAVAVAATYLSPKFKIFPRIKGGIPLWILSSVYMLVSFGAAAESNPGNISALAFAGLTGFVFTQQLTKGKDWGKWMTDFGEWLNDLFNPEKLKETEDIKTALFYMSEQPPFLKKPKVTQQRIDELLDKINIKGYSSLTNEEKNFLKNAGKEEL